MIPWLTPEAPFPALNTALKAPNGLLAVGGDLSTRRLLEAYRLGIFPWFNKDDPILWWSPNPRMVLFTDELKISRSLRKTLKNMDYEIRTDSAFQEVISACAESRKGSPGTWIHEDMLRAYNALHEMGLAHSVEVWMNGELIGGLYGVSLGRMFFGESMFSRVSNASKIALVHLVWQLERWGFSMIDCQMKTEHLASLGGREISRNEFSEKLKELVNYPGRVEKWYFGHESVE